jgi:subtilisin family serine protease
LVLAAVVSLAVAASPATATIRFGPDRDSGPRGEPRPAVGLLVQFRPGVLDADQRRAIGDAGGRLGLKLGLVRGFSVAVRDGTLEALRERLRAAPGVLRVEDNAPMAVAKDPNDPGFGQQYALADGSDDDIDAPAAWNEQTSCAKVAVLDTGIQLDHPDLKQNLWKNPNEKENGRDDDGNGYVDDIYGVDLVTGKGSGEDHNGHGTHVAGIIGARGNNDRGISGLCWKTKLVSVRVMDADGRGYVADQIAGIQYALRVGAKIINCSFGNTDNSSVLRDAIAEARKKDTLIVASAGNDGANADKKPIYPAAYPDSNVLSVAATDDHDRLASFSNYGASSVDLAAPGDHVGSTFLGSDYVYMSGTSMAAPYVAAAAAMLREAHGSWDAGDISSRLRSKGDELSALRGKTTSGRRLNVNRALG